MFDERTGSAIRTTEESEETEEKKAVPPFPPFPPRFTVESHDQPAEVLLFEPQRNRRNRRKNKNAVPPLPPFPPRFTIESHDQPAQVVLFEPQRNQRKRRKTKMQFLRFPRFLRGSPSNHTTNRPKSCGLNHRGIRGNGGKQKCSSSVSPVSSAVQKPATRSYGRPHHLASSLALLRACEKCRRFLGQMLHAHVQLALASAEAQYADARQITIVHRAPR